MQDKVHMLADQSICPGGVRDKNGDGQCGLQNQSCPARIRSRSIVRIVKGKRMKCSDLVGMKLGMKTYLGAKT